jgi:hypothetical protein
MRRLLAEGVAAEKSDLVADIEPTVRTNCAVGSLIADRKPVNDQRLVFRTLASWGNSRRAFVTFAPPKEIELVGIAKPYGHDTDCSTKWTLPQQF